jgi:hypothetical protein
LIVVTPSMAASGTSILELRSRYGHKLPFIPCNVALRGAVWSEALGGDLSGLSGHSGYPGPPPPATWPSRFCRTAALNSTRMAASAVSQEVLAGARGRHRRDADAHPW